MGVNMEDEELVKIFNPTLQRRETILFFLIVVINGLTWIVSDIGLDMCAKGRWRVEVSKLEMNQLALVQIVLCNFLLYVNNIQKYYSVSFCVISIITVFVAKLCLQGLGWTNLATKSTEEIMAWTPVECWPRTLRWFYQYWWH